MCPSEEHDGDEFVMEDKSVCFQFDTIEVWPAAFAVNRDGERLNLEPKAIRVLLHLIHHRDRVVTKDELVETVWEGAAVTDNAITRVVAQLRRELGDDPRAAKYIETAPTLGYRFVGTLREARKEEAAPVAGGRKWWYWAAAGVAVVAVGGWLWPGRPATVENAAAVEVAQITTTSGLDARPSWGPDGRGFVYCSNKSGRFELYRRQAGTEAAEVALTNDGQQNIQPAWSPDGKWIAYHSVVGRGIWVIPAAGGAARRMTNFGANPAWAPDSGSVAFALAEPKSLAPFDAGGAGTIWTAALEGGALRQVTMQGTPRGVHTAPSWSRDGKQIVFTAMARDSGIHVLDLATGKIRPLVGVGVDIPRQPGTYVSRVWDPVFGPEDRKVYFSAAGEKGTDAIWEVAAEGGKPRRLYATTGDTPAGLSLSPDGRRLLFARLRNVSQLWKVGAEGTARPVFQEEVLRAYVPSFSPDGKWMAFAVETQGRNRTFWMMPAEGGAAMAVANDAGQKEGGTSWTTEGELLYNAVEGGEVEFRAFDPRTRKTRVIHKRSTLGLFHPVLLPNGKDLLSSCSMPFNVCVGPVEAVVPKQITFERDGATFAFGDRKGEWIGFQVRRGDYDQIGVVRKDGTGMKVLGQEPEWQWAHSFSGDGRRIAYASFRAGVWTLWWVDRETGERKQLTRETGFGPFVRSPAWRPGTEEIAYESFQVRGNVFQLELVK